MAGQQEQQPNGVIREPSTGHLDVIENFGTIKPHLLTFIQVWQRLNPAQIQEGNNPVNYDRHSNQQFVFAKLLGQRIRGEQYSNAVTPYASIGLECKDATIQEKRAFAQRKKPHIENVTIASVDAFDNAYLANIEDSLVIGSRRVLEGNKNPDILNPAKISAFMQHVSGRLTGDEQQWIEGLQGYNAELRKASKWNLKKEKKKIYALRATSPSEYKTFYDNALAYGDLAPAVLEIGNTLLDFQYDEHFVYHPQGRNSIFFGGQLFNGSAGGEIADSVMAFCDPSITPFTGAIDMHVVNSYVLSPTGQVTYVEDSRFGYSAGRIDWHDYPDFLKLFRQRT